MPENQSLFAFAYVVAAVIVWVETLVKNQDSYDHFSDVLIVGIMGFLGACVWPVAVFFWLVWKAVRP